MLRLRTSLILLTLNAAAIPAFLPASAGAQSAPASGSAWTFAVSGDSRNCGDFVVPAIAAKVKAENDAFYWHLGDFRWISQRITGRAPGTTFSPTRWLRLALSRCFWAEAIMRRLLR